MYDAISEAEAYITESIESLHHDEVSEKKIFGPFSKGFTPVLTNDHRIMTLLNEYGHGKYLKIYSDVQKLVVPVRRGEPVAIIDRYPTKVWCRQLPIGTIGRIGDMKHISLLDYDPALTLAMHYNCPQGDCYHIYRDVQTKLGLGGRNADYKNPNIFCWRNPMMDVSIESLLKSSNYDPINRSKKPKCRKGYTYLWYAYAIDPKFTFGSRYPNPIILLKMKGQLIDEDELNWLMSLLPYIMGTARLIFIEGTD